MKSFFFVLITTLAFSGLVQASGFTSTYYCEARPNIDRVETVKITEQYTDLSELISVSIELTAKGLTETKTDITVTSEDAPENSDMTVVSWTSDSYRIDAYFSKSFPSRIIQANIEFSDASAFLMICEF
jgi:hypothetical protein